MQIISWKKIKQISGDMGGWPPYRRIAGLAVLHGPDRLVAWLPDVQLLQACRRLLAGLAMLAIPAGYASETAAGDFQLFAQPSICVSYNSEEPCLMSMEVSWKGKNPADVCLREAIEEPMLYCWENTSHGSVEIDYANTGDVLYQLVDEASLGVLAETEIKVINRDLRSSRKRRRHVWSIL